MPINCGSSDNEFFHNIHSKTTTIFTWKEDNKKKLSNFDESFPFDSLANGYTTECLYIV